MQRLAILGVLAAACLAGSSPGLAAPPIAAPVAAVVQPHLIPVPADVIAAHPNGFVGGMTAVADVQATARLGTTPNADDRAVCWRGYFTADNSSNWGTEKEWVNPQWCGNGAGTLMKSMDNSWHGQNCSLLVGCHGESGIGNWYGCATNCLSLGQQITGHFTVYAIYTLSIDLTLQYEVYPNGGYWSYQYHN